MIVESPCISVCSVDPDSGYCVGCNRTEEEMVIWKLAETTDEWKLQNLEELKTR
tara:strand:- start:377 stop:538 length:162 start_codon:yes stop_codon:yes gene_type:complete